MSEVTLLGTGAMGTAIGRALLDSKFDITVWNRSSDKAAKLIDLGARPCVSLESAIDASPRIIVCITQYRSALQLLQQACVSSRLKDKTIIQLSTGTPGEVRKVAQFVKNRGAEYLDGSIMVYPETMGKKTAQILVSGDELIFRDCQPYLNCLGGDVRYVGKKIAAAAALDLAVLSRLCAITPGVINGVNICESEGIPLTYYAELFPEGDRARSLALSVHDAKFTGDITASVNTAISCISAIEAHCVDLGINRELPQFWLSLYQRAVDAGWADHDTACLIRVLRGQTH